jgi:chlorosome envelope protein I
VEVRLGQRLLPAINRAGAPLGQSCRGQGVCRACVVTVVDGQEALSPRNEVEARWLVEPGRRLACQARVVGDAQIVLHSPHWGGEASVAASEVDQGHA